MQEQTQATVRRHYGTISCDTLSQALLKSRQDREPLLFAASTLIDGLEEVIAQEVAANASYR